MVPGLKRMTIGGPKGKEANVRPVEAMVGFASDGSPVMTMVVHLDDDDIRKIILNDGHFYLTQVTSTLVQWSLSHIHP
jgi:hypothetical protein